MICLVGNRPVLQIGKHQVTGYGTAWINEAINRAAEACDRADFPFTEDIVKGVVHYLETRCPLRLLPLEDFYKRLEHMLRQIDCAAIAAKLPRLAPAVTISLARAAKEAGDGLELAFFQTLHAEVDELQLMGVESINFTGIKESVAILLGHARWNARAKSLASEIIDFVRLHEQSKHAVRKTRLLVEAI